MSLLETLRRPDMQPLRRLAEILTGVAVLDGAVVLAMPAHRSVILAGIIPAMIPLLVAVFVIPAILKKDQQK